MNRHLRSSLAGIFCLVVAISGMGHWGVMAAGGNEIEAVVEGFVNEQMRLFHWNVSEMTIEKQSDRIAGSRLEAVWLVTLKHTLAYETPDETPVMRGKLAFYSKHKQEYCAKALMAMEDDIEGWRSDLREYIAVPQDFCEIVKTVVEIDSGGRARLDSVSMYVQREDDSFEPVSSYLEWQKMPDQVESVCFNDMRGLADAAQSAFLLKDEVEQEMSLRAVNIYSGTAAVAYADQWVRDTTLTCDGITREDQSNWNPAYSGFSCVDCANFVSQCMAAGNMITGLGWEPYTSAWVNCDYMVTHFTEVREDAFTPATYSNCRRGDVAFTPTQGHVMLITYNDGTVTKFNAHTSDRYRTQIGSGNTFYHVACWVI